MKVDILMMFCTKISLTLNLLLNTPQGALGFPGGISGKKNPPVNAGEVRDEGSIPGSERSPGGEHGSPLQYSFLENPHGQRSLARYSPLGCKESDMIEQLSTAHMSLTHFFLFSKKIFHFKFLALFS